MAQIEELRTCRSCGEEKSIASFRFRSKRRGVRHTTCGPCNHLQKQVLRLWGDRGTSELKAKVLELTEGRTSAITEISGREVDTLIKGF